MRDQKPRKLESVRLFETIRDAAYQALEEYNGGATEYFKELMVKDPKTFINFIGRFVPKQVDQSIELDNKYTIEVVQFGGELPSNRPTKTIDNITFKELEDGL